MLGQNVSEKLDKKEKFETVSSLYVLNCFKLFLIYILGDNIPNMRQEKYLSI